MVATSGIIVTSEPVRDRIMALTRSMSAATRETSWSIDAVGGFKGYDDGHAVLRWPFGYS